MKNENEAETLRHMLEQVDLDPQRRREAEDLLKRATSGDPLARMRIEKTVRERAGFSLLPGTSPAIAPGPLMVCPIDPAHYRVHRREVAEELACPEHGAALVLAKD